FQLLKHKKPGCVVSFGFETPQDFGRFQQGKQQPLAHAPSTDDPGRDPVNAGVEEVESDVDPPQVTAPNQLLGNGFELVRENHDVVTIRSDSPADVQQDFIEVHEYRGDLVRNDLGRVVVPGVQAQELFAGNSVSQIKLVGADDITFGTDAEQLSLNGVA